MIEAAVSGVPVIATGIFAGVVQDGVNGILMEPFDAEKAADWLLKLHRDPQAWRRMSEAGRASALERFGGEIQAARFAEIAEALALNGRRES